VREKIITIIMLSVFGTLLLLSGIKALSGILSVILMWFGVSFICGAVYVSYRWSFEKVEKDEKKYVVIGIEDDGYSESVSVHQIGAPASLELSMIAVMSLSEMADGTDLELCVVSEQEYKDILNGEGYNV